jgi:hypothetical protein
MQRDLIVLVADADAQRAIETLLTDRRPGLRIREIDFRVENRAGAHDSWVYVHGHEYLRERRARHGRAIVVFDLEGSGAEGRSPEEAEREVERRLRQSGWEEGRVKAIAIAPELEAWAWGRNDRAAQILGVPADELLEVLSRFGLGDSGKVTRPKEALEAILREKLQQRPKSSAIYARMARKMGRLDQCQDRAFGRFLQTLREWFPRPS